MQRLMMQFALSLMTLWLTQTAVATEAETAATAKQELLSFAQQIHKSNATFSAIWPGFWPDQQAFIVVNEGQQSLIYTAATAPVYADNPSEALAEHFYYYSNLLHGLDDFKYEIDFALPDAQLATAINISNGGTSEDVSTLLHEAFHGYQRRAFNDDDAVTFLPPETLATDESRALLALQYELARQIVLTPQHELIEDWLMLRAIMAKAMPTVAGYLAYMEQIEGTAQWVGITARSQTQQAFLATFDTLFTNFTTLMSRPLDVRTSAYVTGAILLHLLDSSSSDHTWQEHIEQGATPIALAQTLFGIAAEEERLAELLEKYDYASFMAAIADDTTHVVQVADIEQSHPYLLDVYVEVSPTEVEETGLPMKFNAGNGGFHELEPSLLLLPAPASFQITSAQSVVAIRGLPVRIDMRKLTEGGVRISVWSQDPWLQIQGLRKFDKNQKLELFFGDSSVITNAPWQLGEHSTREQIVLRLQ
ncbi:hypothetical protein IDAT_06200 [Pseudidiomarina atlantica]|uniref:Uncharacterized protein n=2 Tax=Pseudidiomarina atlantica TaxID=1517416 RepID=A0A094INU2_9GAMM|nr:hypothetical protein IDAT_06200 [Pseudidiomarina atlantica]